MLRTARSACTALSQVWVGKAEQHVVVVIRYICATGRIEGECMRAKTDTYVYVLEDSQKPKIVKKHDLLQRLRSLIAKYGFKCYMS